MGLDPDTNGLSPFLARSLPSCSLFLESSFHAISFISFVSATPILLHFFPPPGTDNADANQIPLARWRSSVSDSS